MGTSAIMVKWSVCKRSSKKQEKLHSPNPPASTILMLVSNFKKDLWLDDNYRLIAIIFSIGKYKPIIIKKVLSTEERS